MSAPKTFTPLPSCGISEILGLLEVLNGSGRKQEIYRLAQDLQMEFGATLTVIRAAEILGFVDTPGGEVVLQPLGQQVSQSRVSQRKVILREQLRKVPLVQTLVSELEEAAKSEGNARMRKEEFLERLAVLVPNEKTEKTFNTLLNWGRYAELFGYNDDLQCFYLDAPEK